MKKDIESNLISKIQERIPDSIKPADYISDILQLSKESAYRRLRGIIPFGFEEILILAKKLDLSADELLKDGKSKHAVFNIPAIEATTEDDGFVKMFKHFAEDIKKINASKESVSMISLNRILSILAHPYETLFKFSYYKWLHQFGRLPLNSLFADFVLPDTLKELLGESYETNSVFIFDKNIIYNTIQEIRYYIDSGLIQQSEVQQLKEELRKLVEETYMNSLVGTFPGGRKHELYYSSLNIENNMSYSFYDNNISSYIWNQSECCIYTSDPQFCELQKSWLESLKRYSVLTSQSNNKMQTNLFNKGLEQIETLL